MKIISISPIRPLRGGIAHSNEIMSENLLKKNEVENVSFKRLFPKILYPGKFQTTSEKNNGTLDSINPLNWIAEKNKIKNKKADAVIFQWWTTFLFPCYYFLATEIKSKKIALCQNVFPHSEGALKVIVNPIHEFFSKLFFSKMDRLVAMSNSDKKILEKIFPNKEIGIYFEPMYDLPELKENKITREQAKKELKLKGNTLLFFGFVREYKGLKYLIDAMPEIVKKTNTELLIVGEFWEPRAKYEKMINELEITKNIRIIDNYVPNEEIAKYFLGADLLVLPYTSISESGVIRMAFNFNIPILSTNVGGNPDHIENNLNGFLVEPENSKEIADKTIEFFSKNLYKKFSDGMKTKRKELEWSDKKEKELLG